MDGSQQKDESNETDGGQQGAQEEDPSQASTEGHRTSSTQAGMDIIAFTVWHDGTLCTLHCLITEIIYYILMGVLYAVYITIYVFLWLA